MLFCDTELLPLVLVRSASEPLWLRSLFDYLEAQSREGSTRTLYTRAIAFIMVKLAEPPEELEDDVSFGREEAQAYFERHLLKDLDAI